MEDKRTAFAIFLIILFVMVYSEMFISPVTRPPSPPPASTSQTTISQSSTSSVTPASEQNYKPTESEPNIPARQHPTPAELKSAPVTLVETGNILVAITHLGGRLTSYKLKHYRDHVGDDTPLDMVSSVENSVLPLAVYSGGLNDDHVDYSVEAATAGIEKKENRYILGPSQELRLKLKGQYPNGGSISKELTFNSDAYTFNVDIKLDKPASDGSSIWLEWSHYLPNIAEQDRLDPKLFTTLDESDKIRHTQLKELGDTLSDPTGAKWVAFNDKYFMSAIVPQIKGSNSRIGREGNVAVERAKGTEASGSFSVYVGPKNLEILKSAGLDLSRSVDLGFFAFIGHPLLLLLKFFHSLFGNYGLAIVLLTLVIKSVFFPLTRASMKSMKAMQLLQPEMKALRERIKDPNQLNQEVMGLYKKHGVNPMGGCLPILIQIPVFFGLYSALQNAIELRHAPFALWIHDLSSPERLIIFGINIPVMILIMGAAMFVQQYTTPNPSMDPTQRKTMLIMSLVFTLSFLIFPFPAGLALYMLVNTSISIVQQFYLQRDDAAAPFRGTALASVGIFLVAWILTKL